MDFVRILLLVFATISITFAEKNENCLINPNTSLSTPELILQSGYPVEVHHVVTSDYYILEIHRIPYGLKSGPGKDKPMVFLMHGLLCSSDIWIITGPERGLGYLLADLGYDVWIGNARGNTYSRNNSRLQPSDSKFWDFSWHEIGIIDIPAMIDYGLQKSGQTKTFYIGHSQGTTSFYVMCSEKPEYNSKIRAMFSLAPIAFMSHMTSPLLQMIAPFEGQLGILIKLIGLNEFLPTSSLRTVAGEILCKNTSVTQAICTNTIFLLCGFDAKQMDYDLLPVIIGHNPAGSSSKQILHYAQGINSGKFRLYDYGLIQNLLIYKSPHPPAYNLSKITAPVSLHYSHNDWLAAEVDVLKLYSNLKNPIARILVPYDDFNHLDYLWAVDVKALVYDKVISLMNKY